MQPIDSRSPRPKQPASFTQRFAPRHRLQVGHVNVGGLSQHRLTEVKAWAQAVETDVLILTETRWSFESEWQDRDWFHIHTRTSDDRANGILFLIRTSVCQANDLGFASGFARTHWTCQDPFEKPVSGQRWLLPVC